MKRQTILLTGDDGFDSLGTRVLIHLLKDSYNLTIAGTTTQQSGVGGHKNIKGTGSWGTDTVDGVPALWLEGSPVDSIEAARVYFNHPFDYVISGINWGANIGGCLFSSGTFSAAFYAANLGLSSRVIVISWDIPADHHFVRHTKEDGVEEFFNHPGISARIALEKTFKNACWGAPIVNINIPKQPSKEIEFASPLPSVYKYWPPIELNKKTGMFLYGPGDHATTMGEKQTDVQVLERGHIAITPCQATMLDQDVYRKVSKLRNI